jgi:hypothetical protein
MGPKPTNNTNNNQKNQLARGNMLSLTQLMSSVIYKNPNIPRPLTAANITSTNDAINNLVCTNSPQEVIVA